MYKTFSFTLTLYYFLFGFITASSAQQTNSKGSVVIELFTSQGDVNCPGADKILTELRTNAAKNGQSVYCISEHVDFWNRFGWTDPFSSLKYTRRLQNYSSVFNETETYTPKFVINGKTFKTTPTKKQIIERVNNELGISQKLPVSFTYEVNSDTLEVSYTIENEIKIGKIGSTNYINIVIVENEIQTKVTKGDNAGKTLLNSNVSRIFFTTNLSEASSVVRVPIKGMKPDKSKTIIVFVQDKKTKTVFGASSKSF